jgi:hypothetical protein
MHSYLNLEVFFTVLIVLWISLFGIGLGAYWDKTFTTRQMVAFYNAKKGQPAATDPALWMEVLVSVIAAAAMGAFADNWMDTETRKMIFASLGFGFILSLVIHAWHVRTSWKRPGAFARNGRISLTGFVHTVFTMLLLAPLIMVYFMVPHYLITRTSLIGCSAILGVYVLLGNGFLAGNRNSSLWSRMSLENPSAWMRVLAVWTLLAWRTWVIVE